MQNERNAMTEIENLYILAKRPLEAGGMKYRALPIVGDFWGKMNYLLVSPGLQRRNRIQR